MPGAGALDERVYFEQRGLDANGDRLGAWEPTTRFDRPVHLHFLRAGETVMHQRLQGVQPVIITVGKEAKTKALTNAWRAVDYRDATRSFDVKGAPVPSKDFGPLYLDIVAEIHVGHDAS